MRCVGWVGACEAWPLGRVEATLKYHPERSDILTRLCNPERRQCLAGSLTGAVASQKVTEAFKGSLRLVGNQPSSAKA